MANTKLTLFNFILPVSVSIFSLFTTNNTGMKLSFPFGLSSLPNNRVVFCKVVLFSSFLEYLFLFCCFVSSLITVDSNSTTIFLWIWSFAKMLYIWFSIKRFSLLNSIDYIELWESIKIIQCLSSLLQIFSERYILLSF